MSPASSIWAIWWARCCRPTSSPAFCRARGYETLCICATDEHGTPAELAALEAGQDVAAYCAEQHAIQKDLGDALRSVLGPFRPLVFSPQNHELTQHFARALWKNGHLEVRTTKQVYSHAEKRFLPDRYVIGTCPHCGYDRARGDQCENCTRVLDPADLINPRSAVSGSSDIEIRDSAHLFLKQSEFVGQLRTWIDSHKNDWPQPRHLHRLQMAGRGAARTAASPAIWNGACRCPTTSATASSRAKSSMSGSMRPSNISPQPRNGPTQTARARPGATGGTARPPRTSPITSSWARTMCRSTPWAFPVTIMGSGEPWKLVDRLKGFNGSTMTAANSPPRSKRGVFMDTALELLPADYWRYYLMANAPESARQQFHLGAFRRRHQQGPGRRAGQFRQPRDQILRRALRRPGAGRGRIWRGRRTL